MFFLGSIPLRSFNRGRSLGVCLLAGLMSFTFIVVACAQSDEDSEFKKGCRACHNELIEKWDGAKTRHFPYAKQKCEVCHAAEHKKFTAEKSKPCTICHSLTSEKLKKAHFNADVTTANCFKCHYTHGSERKGMLKEVLHVPFESGMCDMCHQVTAEGKIEVKGEVKKICTACHSDKTPKADDIVHAGFEMSECTDCHTPHTSPFGKLLVENLSDKCFSCHDKEVAKKHPFDVKASPKTAPKMDVKWLTDGKVTCVSCHEPHFAKVPFLLKAPLEGGKLCDKCHAQ